MFIASMGRQLLFFILVCGAAVGEESCSDSSHSKKATAFVQTKRSGHTLLVDREDQAPGPGVRSVCGDGEEISDVDCLKPSNMALQISQSKATLMMGLGCTGWIVQPPTGSQGARVLTAGHCGSRDPEVFYFDYNTPCGGQDKDAKLDKSCQGKQLARKAYPDDYTVYELDATCQYVAGITPILLDVGEPSPDEGMYLIGHPNMRPKKISFQEVHDAGHHCEVRGFQMSGSKRVTYYCDTQGGNSGSPVFSALTGHAFAIHSHGGCTKNEWTANSGSLLKNSIAVLQQFGIPFVDRSTTDIFKSIQFTRKTNCPVSKTSASLTGKSQDECKKTCMHALKCVGFTSWGSDCTVMYEVHQGQSQACPGSADFYERVYGTLAAPPGPAGSPGPAGPPGVRGPPGPPGPPR